jgi:cytochrome d ubiquinol oxidase subunit I
VAIGTNLSALWILIANGWMQHPVGSFFDFHTMRMEVADFGTVLFNPIAQAKFFHTVSAGYITGSMFILSISCFYLLRKRNIEVMKRSVMVASAFGLAASIFAIVMGDASGVLVAKYQPVKLAAIEAEWTTQAPPAAFNLIAFPNQTTHQNDFAIQIPDALGLLTTHSMHDTVPGIEQLVQDSKGKISNGVKAYLALQTLEKNPNDVNAQATLSRYSDDLGYGMLLQRYTSNIAKATPAQIQQAAWDLVPNVAPLFWTFRLMVGLSFLFFLVFVTAFVLSKRGTFLNHRWFQHVALWCLPLPWVAIECGWFVAEYGRQPWAVQGMLPTYMGASSLTPGTVLTSIAGFVLLYTFLFIIEMFLMVKYIRLGPEHFVKPSVQTKAA